MCFEFNVRAGLAGQTFLWALLSPLIVDIPQSLHYFKKPCPSANAVGFQRGGNRQADGLFGTADIGHHQVGGERVQTPFHALHRGVKRLQVDGDVGPFLVLHLKKNELAFRFSFCKDTI